MNILFLTLLNIRDLDQNGIYHDFVNELIKSGNNVTVVSANEKRNGGKTEYIVGNKADILNVGIGDITKTTVFKKGINILRIENTYKKAINKYLSHNDYDLIIYTTPPITFNSLVKYLKEKFNSKTYLLLKDIFPQNAVDLKLFSKYSLIYHLFRRKEIKLYEISDFIGAMSRENLNFINKHNKIEAKTQISRNALYDYKVNITVEEKNMLYKELGMDPSKNLFLYGGNIGAPQGVNYIKDVMKRFDEIPNSQLLIVGNGTHYKFVKDFSNNLNSDVVKVIGYLEKEKYDKLISICDVGLIFLDHKFTIPNYPSRFTNFIILGKPVIAATDINTDISKEIINNKCGFWNESNDVDAFIENAKKIINKDTYAEMSYNAREFYEKEFRIEDNIQNLLNLVNNN